MTNSRRFQAMGALSCALGVAVVMASFLASPASAVGDPVVVCHQTGNGAYNAVPTDQSGAVSGHSGHANDIIPPIPDYLPGGLNWTTDGQAVYAKGACDGIVTTTTTTTTTEATTTTTEATTTTLGTQVKADETLPHTGTGSAKLLAFGLLLLVGGGLCLTVGDDWLREAAGLHYAKPGRSRR